MKLTNFAKLFLSKKHGQIVVIKNSPVLAVMWQYKDALFNNYLSFQVETELNDAFDHCTLETVERIVSNIKYADGDGEGPGEGVTIQ